MSIELVTPFKNLILCHPVLLLPSVFPNIKVFSKEPAFHIRWPKYWSFSFNISSSKEYSRLISFRMDWLDLLAVQGTLKSLLQNHSSKASILWCSAFFTVQLSHLYISTGKTIALTRQALVSKVTSLLPTSCVILSPSSPFLGHAGLPQGLGAATLSIWNALHHPADFGSQLQDCVPQPSATSRIAWPSAQRHAIISSALFSLEHLPLPQITSLWTCYHRMKAS